MKFGPLTLRGEWVCEKCGALDAPLQVSTLKRGGLNCPGCGNPLVFVTDFVPVSDEAAKKFFELLKKKLAQLPSDGAGI